VIATKYNADINVSDGTPDFIPPQPVLDALVEVAENQTDPNSWTIHQYDDERVYYLYYFQNP